MKMTDVLGALRRFWLLALAVFAVALAAGAAAAFLPKSKYDASATLIVTPKQIDFATISAVNFLMPSVVEQVKTAEFRQRVDRRLAPWVRALAPSLDASFEPGTAIVRVDAMSTSPLAAAAAANAAAHETVSHPISKAAEMELLAPAPVPRSPASPRRVPILAGATALGVMGAVFAALAAGALRR